MRMALFQYGCTLTIKKVSVLFLRERGKDIGNRMEKNVIDFEWPLVYKNVIYT
jgi:hypothetical protein